MSYDMSAPFAQAVVRDFWYCFPPFCCFELDVRVRTSAQGAAFSSPRLKLADIVLI